MSSESGRRVLVLGGIRSGKSELAERLLAGEPAVRYIATGQVSATDAEWTRRIDAHRARRPAGWMTEEVGHDPWRLPPLLAGAGPHDVILVDDIAAWVAAVLTGTGPHTPDHPPDDGGRHAPDDPPDATVVRHPVVHHPDVQHPDVQHPDVRHPDVRHPDVRRLSDELAGAVAACPARLVLVSAEVGLAPVPLTPVGRAFVDALGATNTALAAVCDTAVLVVAGLPVALKGTL